MSGELTSVASEFVAALDSLDVDAMIVTTAAVSAVSDVRIEPRATVETAWGRPAP